MYNQEIKERFLREQYDMSSGGRSYIAVFQRIEPMEIHFGKDIAEMDFDEANRTLLSDKVYSLTAIDAQKSVLKQYVKWCRDNFIFENIPGGVLKVKITIDDVTHAVSQKLFRDESDLLYSIKKVRSFDEGNPEIAVVILAWLGLELEQILELQDSQVDLENGKIFATDGSILVSEISQQLRDILQMYARCESAERMNGTTKYEVIKDRSYPNFIKCMRSRTSTQMGRRLELKAVREMFNRISRDYVELGYESRFAYTNVLSSGRLNRLLQMELSGVDILDSKNAAVVEAVFNGNKKYRSIKWSYESYKKAFNL